MSSPIYNKIFLICYIFHITLIPEANTLSTDACPVNLIHPVAGGIDLSFKLFIENALNLLQQGGRCAAIVQMSCATSTNENTIKIRSRLAKRHRRQ